MALPVGEKPALSRGDMRLTTRQRIENYSIAEPNTGCWLWLGSIGSSGYGHLRVNGRTRSAARLAYEIFRGSIPEGYEPDHLCRVRSCVNPDHLECVTHSENVRRQSHAEQLTCKKGHPLDGIRSRSIGGRYCRICVAASKRRQRARRDEHLGVSMEYDAKQMAATLTRCEDCGREFYMTVPQPVCVRCRCRKR